MNARRSTDSGKPDGRGRRESGRAAPDGDTPLDERKARILESVVTEYVETAQPVGSSHVVASAGLGISPATVRNEMSVLEEEGYLVQPHTSAGRIPTDKGYRLFVDRLAEPSELGSGQREEVRSFFTRTHVELEQMLAETTRLLSSLTRYAAVVVAPQHDSATVRSAQLVSIAPHSLLVVLVLSDGTVEKFAIDVEGEPSSVEVEASSQRLAAALVGQRRDRISSPTGAAGAGQVERLVAAALAGLAASSSSDGDAIYVGGASKMAEAFDAIETVRSVLTILEQQIMVVSLVRGVLDRDELTVAIGREHGVVPLAECAVVVQPYHFGEGELGVIGVLGPTRMQYAKAMSAVAAVGQELETRLTES